MIRYCCDGRQETYSETRWKYWSALIDEEKKNAKFDYIEISKKILKIIFISYKYDYYIL